MADIEINDENSAELLGRFTGLKVLAISREPDSGDYFKHGENDVDVLFEDGSKLHLSGWGYDASGLHATYSPPPPLAPTLDTGGPDLWVCGCRVHGYSPARSTTPPESAASPDSAA